MKLTVTSTFHAGMRPVVFIGLAEGMNYRRLSVRSCRGYANKTNSGCVCGFPIGYARWELSDPDYYVEGMFECGRNGEYGCGYLGIEVSRASDRDY